MKSTPFTKYPSKIEGAGSKPLIIFVHNYAGSQRILLRHIRMVNNLGYDAIGFDLSWHGQNPARPFPHNLFKRWSEEILGVVDSCDPTHSRKKVVFGFSGPSASALRAIAVRQQSGQNDIVGFIGDSGPFLDAMRCGKNLVEKYYGVKFRPARDFFVHLSKFIGGADYSAQLKKHANWIASNNPLFPVLSLRSGADPLVPNEEIERVFAGSGFKNIHVKIFEGVDHMAGLRDQASAYSNTVREFLGAI
jgi:alpha-beta hydrolase superfamily lysophospholipase